MNPSIDKQSQNHRPIVYFAKKKCKVSVSTLVYRFQTKITAKDNHDFDGCPATTVGASRQ